VARRVLLQSFREFAGRIVRNFGWTNSLIALSQLIPVPAPHVPSRLAGPFRVCRAHGWCYRTTAEISANGSFTFTTAVDSGGAYSVTVLTLPSSPVQNCVVNNGSGTANGNVTNVQVVCTTGDRRRIRHHWLDEHGKKLPYGDPYAEREGTLRGRVQ
jgi:hypothetical protein